MVHAERQYLKLIKEERRQQDSLVFGFIQTELFTSGTSAKQNHLLGPTLQAEEMETRAMHLTAVDTVDRWDG